MILGLVIQLPGSSWNLQDQLCLEQKKWKVSLGDYMLQVNVCAQCDTI